MAGGAERIRAAALELFAEAGYDGVSMSDLAKAAGMKPPSIYAHYDSKEALFLGLFDEAARQDAERVAALAEEGSGASAGGRLEAIFRHYTDLGIANAAQSFLKRTMLMPPKRLRSRMEQAFLAYESRLTERLDVLLAEGARSGEWQPGDGPQRIALFYALIDGLLLEQQWYGGELYRARQRMVWEAYRDGLRRG